MEYHIVFQVGRLKVKVTWTLILKAILSQYNRECIREMMLVELLDNVNFKSVRCDLDIWHSKMGLGATHCLDELNNCAKLFLKIFNALGNIKAGDECIHINVYNWLP